MFTSEKKRELLAQEIKRNEFLAEIAEIEGQFQIADDYRANAQGFREIARDIPT